MVEHPPGELAAAFSLRSPNDSPGWYKTIFLFLFFSPRPTRMKKPQQKKCHGVKTYAHIFPLGRQSNAKKWNKERALASLSLSHRSSARNSWIYDDAEVLPQSLPGSFLQEPVFKESQSPKSQFNKIILVPNLLNCYLTPEDRGPPTPRKHPPCYNTEQMTGLLDWCLRVGVSKCVCFRVWGDRNQESCAIRHLTRSCILDLDTYGSGTSVDILLRLKLLIMYTDTPHYIYI